MFMVPQLRSGVEGVRKEKLAQSSTFLGRLGGVDLIKWVSNVHPPVHKKFLRLQRKLVCR